MHSLSAQLTEAWRLRALLGLMTARDIRSRFSGTALGLVWLYVQPVLTVVSYYFVFDVVLKTRLAEGAPTRSLGFYLVVGMMPWIAFSDALTRAMNSLVEAGNLLQKNALIPLLFPARAVAASALTYVPPIALVALAAVFVNGPSPALLALPVVLVVQVALSFVLGYAFAILAAAMRDVMQVVGFLLSLGIFASPVLFTMDMIPEGMRWLLWLNPMTPVILAVQDILLAGRFPPLQSWGVLALWLTVSTLVLDRLIKRSGEHLVEWL